MDNKKPFILFIVLLFVAGSSYAWLHTQSHKRAARLFVDLDTAQIQAITLVHPQDSCQLQRQGPSWQINTRYEVDHFILRSLFQILAQTQSRRLLVGAEATRIHQQLQIKGSHVHITCSDQRSLRFSIWGEPLSGRSYILLPPTTLHEIHMPKHSGYLAALFFLTEIQWRSRRLFHSPATTLQQLSLRYPKNPENDFQIHIQDQKPYIQDPSPIDTLALYKYLRQYEHFYTNEYIQKGQVPTYDSLLKETPLAYLQLKDLHKAASKDITVYARAADPYFLLQENKSQYSLCERKRFQPFLRKRSYFLEKSRTFP